MGRNKIVILGVPEQQSARFQAAVSRVEGLWELVPGARLKNTVGGYLYLPPGEEPLTRSFDALCGLIREDTSIRPWAREALSRGRYRKDPTCLIAVCDRPPCARVCGSDQWSTPQYQRLIARGTSEWWEDCDGFELMACGGGTGRPLFVLPERGKLGHVMHDLGAGGDPVSRAIDYCIPGGMRPWGGPRQVVCYEGGNRREGVINNSGQAPNVFYVQWRKS